MATEPLFKDHDAMLEYHARKQLGVGDDYHITNMIMGIPVGLERLIDNLNDRDDLDDDERWEALNEEKENLPTAWFESEKMLVAMRHEQSPKGQIDVTGMIDLAEWREQRKADNQQNTG